MPTTVFTIDEFVRDHGGYPMRVNPEVWILPDGASYARNYRPGSEPCQYPPPPDAIDRQRAVVQYWRLRVDVGETCFRDLKLNLQGHSFNRVQWQPQWGPVPDLSNELGCLKLLAKAVTKERKKLEEAWDKLQSLPEIVAQRAADTRDQQLRDKRDRDEMKRRNDIDSVTI